MSSYKEQHKTKRCVMKKNGKYEFGKGQKKAANTDVFYLDLKGVDTETGIQMLMDFCDNLAAKYGHYHVVVDGGEGQQLHLVK